MKNKLQITILLLCSIFTPASAENSELVGAWNGPKDLMINICSIADNQLSVCHCGIFRTFGWTDVSLTVQGDSLIMNANDPDSPFEGRLLIETSDKLTGTITMGRPGEDWYFNGRTELIKQKAIMPEGLNHNLEGVIHPSDYGALALDRKQTWDILSTISPSSYGYTEKGMVEKLLNAKVYPITPRDLTAFRRVRSIQIAARDGIFSYPYFKCRFTNTNGKVFFEKTTGSQRKSGHVYQNTPKSLIFLGGWSVNDDPQTSYDSTNSVAGTVYKIGPGRAIMIFPTDANRVEIYELVK
ncbi:MAG: DUF4893 domain-containing protein [Prevotellaceae bacterium]|nr:DUF4893 domain-containing protein [Prevotellaceae bacterium]